MSHLMQDTHNTASYLVCTGLYGVMLRLASTDNQKKELKTARNRILSNNSFAKLVNTSLAFCGIRSFTKFHYILNQRNEVLILPTTLFNMHFNIILPTTSSSSKDNSEKKSIIKNPKHLQLVVLEILFIAVKQMSCYLKPVNNGNVSVGWE